MRRRLYAVLAPLMLPLAGGGCVQATRHSNALIFGTNTSFGIQVGTSATQVPSIIVGYNRQEAVLVPLVANTNEMTAGKTSGSVDRLTPCKMDTAITAPAGARFVVHPCSLVGINGKAMDSYSVLASFGAKFGANAGSNSVDGGLAQYFATGIAAQLLAATGGASVIATGQAATASALKAPNGEAAIAALYGQEPAFAKGVVLADAFGIFFDKLAAKMVLTDVQNLKTRVGSFETASASLIKVSDSCTNATVCKAAARSAYAIGYQRTPKAFEDALEAWTIP